MSEDELIKQIRRAINALPIHQQPRQNRYPLNATQYDHAGKLYGKEYVEQHFIKASPIPKTRAHGHYKDVRQRS